MATKTITASVTLHVAGKLFKPFKFSDSGIVTEGKYDVIEVKPGTPAVIDADEADRLIARKVAELYVAPEAAAPVVPVEAPKK